MNPLHHPDITRCEQLEKAGFPETYRSYNDGDIVFTKSLENTWRTINVCVCPSVSELLDVIPRDEDCGFSVDIREQFKDYFIDYQVSDGEVYAGRADTLQNALSDLVLWLISKGYRFEDGKLIK